MGGAVVVVAVFASPSDSPNSSADGFHITGLGNSHQFSTGIYQVLGGLLKALLICLDAL